MDQVLAFVQANYPLAALIGLTILDIFSGLVAAAINGQVDQTVAFQGAIKKSLLYFVVAIAYLVEHSNPSVPLVGLTIGFYITSELTSVIVNLQKCGVPIPGEILAVSQIVGSISSSSMPTTVQTTVSVPSVATGTSSQSTLVSSLGYSGTGVTPTVKLESVSLATSEAGVAPDPVDVANAEGVL